jgi:hypothetical protein
MYGRLADSKLFGGDADRRLVLYDVPGERDCPLLDVSLQEATLPV